MLDRAKRLYFDGMPIVIGDVRVYTFDEIEGMLSVSRRTLWGYIKSGRLKAVKFGSKTYITEKSLEEYFNPPKRGR